MKILFFSSDNNITSGAFLSMVTLNKELRDLFNVKTKIVLPCKGDGEVLLKKYGLEYCRLSSGSGVIPSPYRFYFKIWKKQNVDNNLLFFKIYIDILLNQIGLIKITSLIRDFNPDIIHINTTYHYLGARGGLKENIPFVWHIREIIDENYDSRYILERKRYELMKKANTVIAISRYVENKYKGELFNIKLIYNGVDVDKFYKPNKLIFVGENVYILCVGYPGKWKGRQTVIDAAKFLYYDYCGFDLFFVGKGGGSNSLKEHGNTGAAKNRIHFEEYTTEPEKYYEKADIFIMSSRAEAFGRVTVEAMMAGCLVIASDTGANPEFIGDNEYGLLYRYDDSSDLCEKIKYAINNKEEMRKIADRARKRAVKEFSSENNTNQIYTLYKEVLATRGQD